MNILRSRFVCVVTTITLFIVTISGDSVVTSVKKCCPLGNVFDSTGDGQCNSGTEGNGLAQGQWDVPRRFMFENYEKLTLRWDGEEEGLPACGKSPLKTVFVAANGRPRGQDPSAAVRYLITDAGVLMEVWEEKLGGVIHEFSVNHQQHQFCVDPTSDGVFVRICPARCDSGEPCLRKCCPVGQHFVYDSDGFESCAETSGPAKARNFTLLTDEGLVLRKTEAAQAQPRYTSGGEYGVVDCLLGTVRVSLELPSAHLKKTFGLSVKDGRPLYYSSRKNKWDEFADIANHCAERVVTDELTNGVEVLYLCVNSTSGSADSVSVSEPETSPEPEPENPVIWTYSGSLRGRVQLSRNGRKFSSYEGIPYSRPEGRFEPSKELFQWGGIRDALTPGPKCPQFEPLNKKYHADTEDCLFLNVYVPQIKMTRRTRLPVMVWIHGGGFAFGSGSELGPEYFMDQDIILVTINYRLGVFGFLNTGDGAVTGNMGLGDMILALKWVQLNTPVFGGDGNSVTIFGESAGGAAVHALMLSPAAAGLFHRAIAQSGTLFNPWSFSRDSSQLNRIYFNATGCSGLASTDVVNCLKSKSVLQLLQAAPHFSDDHSFGPTLDTNAAKPILPDLPQKLIWNTNNSANISFIVGMNVKEMLVAAAEIIKSKETIGRLNENWREGLSAVLKLKELYPDHMDFTGITSAIKTEYFRGKEIGPDSLSELTTLLSDVFFLMGIKNAALSHARRGAPVFPYLLTYSGEFSLSNRAGLPSEGPVHADELQYLFPSRLSPQKNWPDLGPGSADEEFSKKFVALWASFAKTGIPIPWSSSWDPISQQLVDTEETNARLNWLNLQQDPKQEEESIQMVTRLGLWHKEYSSTGTSTRPVPYFPTVTIFAALVVMSCNLDRGPVFERIY